MNNTTKQLINRFNEFDIIIITVISVAHTKKFIFFVNVIATVSIFIFSSLD